MEPKVKEEPTDITSDGYPCTRVLEGPRRGALHIVYPNGHEVWEYPDGTSEWWCGEK